MAGQDVCRSHGGAAAQNRAKGAERMAHQQAERAVRTLGLPVDIRPEDALLEEVRWTAGHVAWLRRKVQELDEQPTHTMTNLLTDEDEGFGSPVGNENLVWGTTRVKVGGDDRGTTQEAKPSIWYELYARERTHLVKVASEALRAGVEERKVRLAENQAGVVVGVIQRILDGLYTALTAAGITPNTLQQAWTTAVADVVPRELRAAALGQE